MISSQSEHVYKYGKLDKDPIALKQAEEIYQKQIDELNKKYFNNQPKND